MPDLTTTPMTPLVQPPNPVGPETPAPTTADPSDAGTSTPANLVPPLAPSPSPSPVPSAPHDDFTPDYADHLDTTSGSNAWADIDRELAQPSATPVPGEVSKQNATPSGKVPGKSVALDIARGIGEAPSMISSGVRAGINNMTSLAGDFGDWLDKELPGMNVKDFSFHGVKPFQRRDGVEPGKEPTSTTGGLIKGVAQFLTGFAAGGPAAEGLGLEGLGAGLVKGGVADFTAFNKHENAVHDLVDQFPVLKNPVTDFLAGDPNDSEVTGRLKNALTGLGLGVAAEGLVKGLSYVKSGQVAEAAQRAAAKMEGTEAVPREAKATDFSVLGDSEKPLIYKAEDKLATATSATEGMQPSDVKGRAKAGDQTYINFAKIDTPDDVKQVIKKMANSAAKDISEEARGTRSWEQTKLSAEQEDAWKLLMNRRTGEAMNAEQSVASRQLWATSATKLKEVAKLASEAPTEANAFAFRKQLAVHYAIQKEVIAARTETARALNAWKIPAGVGKLQAQQMDAVLEAAGGVQTAQDMAKKIAMLGEAGMDKAVEGFVEKSVFARSRDAVSQVWINSLLSNPATHVANSMSNMAAAVQQIAERKAGEYLSQSFGTDGGVELGEAAAMMHGMMSGLKDSFEAFSKKVTSIKSPADAMDSIGGFIRSDAETPAKEWEAASSKLEAPPPGALSAERWNIAQGSDFGKALDVIDVGTRLPGRMLSAADDVYKMIGYRMELHAQAVRQATQEMRGGTISPEEFKGRVAAIIENPPNDIRLEAVNAATYQTFTGKPAAVLKGLGDAVQKIPLFGRLILPFKNTPINVLTFATERSPMAPLIKTWRADVAAGGARRDIALAKMGTGTMIMSLAMDSTLSGHVTGKGPEDPGQRALLLREGWQPYSVKVGGKWVAYNRLDPIGLTMGMAADMAEAVVNAQKDVDNQHFEKAYTHAFFAISNNVLNKTYMQGVSDWFGAINNPQQKSDSLFQKVVGSAVPAGVANASRQIDPYMREAEDGIDALRRRVPGLSSELPPYRDLWGREVSYRSPLGAAYDMFSPVYVRNEHKEPVDKEMENLQYYPEMPNKKMTFHSPTSMTTVPIELNAKQFSRLMQLSGNEYKNPALATAEQPNGMGLKDFLNAVVEGKHQLSSVYNMKTGGPDGTKAEFIRNWIDRFRNDAKKQLFNEDGTLQATYEAKVKLKPGKIDPKLTGGM